MILHHTEEEDHVMEDEHRDYINYVADSLTDMILVNNEVPPPLSEMEWASIIALYQEEEECGG